MRDYAKLGPKMWHGKTIRDLRKRAEARALEGAPRGSEGIVVALYLMTSPSSNMLGLFTQPILYMAHETYRKSVETGKSVSVRVEICGRRNFKKKTTINISQT